MYHSDLDQKKIHYIFPGAQLLKVDFRTTYHPTITTEHVEKTWTKINTNERRWNSYTDYQ